MKQQFINRKTFAITAILICITQISFAPSASAVKGYRYWGYFQASPNATSWEAAMTGPTVKLTDGAVEGWSFSASNDVTPATPPNDSPDFATLCADTPEANGKIRVGLVINFGPESIAPNDEMPPNTILSCVLVKKNATGTDVLNAAVTVRNDKSGLLCGIEGYPKSECGPEIDMPEITAVAASGELEEKEELGKELEIETLIALSIATVIAIALAVGIKRRRK